ncbi:MAG: hypothetical protein P1S46_07355 [bacterium]|nr:hypothetical protein [bacterium]MDT8395658.1 hypothetical protein [bacterium]
MTRKAYRVRKKGLRKRDGVEYPFYPNYVIRGFMVVAAAFALIAFLSAAFPPSLDRAADPLLTGPDPEIKVVWILKPAIMAERIIGSRTLTSSVTAVLLLGFVLLPILDRSGRRRLQKRLFLVISFLFFILFFVLSLLLHSGGWG